MTRQSMYKSTISFRESVPQALKPYISGVDRREQEICINLPFALVFESLTYIGTVSRETWHVRPHYHDHFELCYVDEGEGWFAINDFSYPVKNRSFSPQGFQMKFTYSMSGRVVPSDTMEV